MEDDDVLMENDPLAKYLLNEKIQDFEIFQAEQNIQNETVLEVKHKKEIVRSEEDMQSYFENILKSELLLEEDYNILETSYMYSYVPVSKSFIYKISLSSCITAVGIGLFKYTNSSIVRKLLPLCSIPLAINIYNYAKKKLKNRRVSLLLVELQKLTSSIKKCLRIVSELSATIGYYSSATANTSSFNNVHIRFAKEFYALLLNVIKLLANNSSEIMQAVPLTIDNYMKYDLNEELLIKSSVNNSDLKFLFELYILVQSDFIKTLGLSFCTYLWALPDCDINKILTKIIPNTLENVREKVKTLDKEYTFLRNYGIHSKNDSIRSPVKFKQSPLNYMHSCLHNAELHFQQLFCKTRDLQDLLNKMDSEYKDDEANQIMVSLNEIDKQIVSSKNMIDAVTKYLNQLQKKDENTEISIPVQQPTVNNAVKTVANSEEEMKPDKLVYELYIPKEGLDLTELELDSERPMFTLKDLDYSGVMLDELRTILRARNPEMFQEEATNKPEINSDSEDEESFYKSRRRDVFRPTQPIGLAENLQSISQVLAARKAMMQSEELFNDTFSNSDTDDVN